MTARGWIITLLWLGCLRPGSAFSQTYSPQKVLGRYQQFVWLEQHGLPQNTVLSILRTREGYLWLGTLAGAARFDGVRFTVFDHGNTDEIKGSLIRALLEDSAGNLWLGTDGGGLNLYRNGRFSRYTTRDGLPDDNVQALVEDGEGGLWVGTLGGLARFRDGRFIVYTTRDGLPNAAVQALAKDREGGLWVGTRGGLARFKDGRFITYTTRDGLTNNIVRSLCWDRADNLWVGAETGLSQFKAGRLIAYGGPPMLAHNPVHTLNQDREGNLWIGTIGGGLFRLKDGRLVRYTAREGLPGDRVAAIYQDPEGDLWVGTDGGLSQLKDGHFQVYTAQDGLAHDFAMAVYEDVAGSLWVGTVDGLSRLKDGKFTRYTSRDGVPAKSIRSICEDAAGDLWLGTSGGGVTRFKQGRFTTLTTKDGLSSDLVEAVHADHAGNLWVATKGDGLNLWRDGRFTLYTTRDGLASDDVRTLFEDRAGNLWAGSKNGSISRFKDGRFTTWVNQDGRAHNLVTAFYEDRSGAIWIGTLDDGLSRFKDGKFAAITVRDGLYDNIAFQILSDTDDDSGNLWMSCNKGIYRVSLKELNDFADGRITSVTSFAYGVADGMLSRECNGSSPAGWKTRDGRLWFPTARGVVAVDPRRKNTPPPLLAIEQVMLDRVALPRRQVVEIRPGQGNLEIHYTGLSWSSRPQQIRFKYRLAGLDRDWEEAGARRTAYYSHLPPGSYTFTVIADNGEGVWNTEGQSLRIVVLPPFYRTWWFMTLAALGVAGVVQLALGYRLAQLQKKQRQQQAFSRQLIESQERERKRIAAELHDSLGQNLLIVKNRAQLGQLAAHNAPELLEQFEWIVNSATQSIEEVREIAQNLRPYHLDRLGLTKALEVMIEKVAATTRVRSVSELLPLDDLFSKEDAITLYRVVQESLNNIIKHAQASMVCVSVERLTDSVTLTIQDNGRGFSLLEAAAKPSGFGLAGMAERVRMLGGALQLDSHEGQGTTVTVRLALPVTTRGKRNGR